MSHDEPEAGMTGREWYLDLLKRSVTNVLYQDPPITPPWEPPTVFDADTRMRGMDWPSEAHTMIGFTRLDHLRTATETVLADGVPGDFLEAGVFRGGAMVFLRGVLRVHGVADRAVWLADSFQGFPTQDQDEAPELAAVYTDLAPEVLAERVAAAEALNAQFQRGSSVEEVRDTFARYGLLDEQVRFLPGWFSDTLPTAPVQRLAILRADSDLYDSTYTTLENLYPKVSDGGFVIIDDYHVIQECRRAVHDYLKTIDAEPHLQTVDECAVFWRKRN